MKIKFEKVKYRLAWMRQWDTSRQVWKQCIKWIEIGEFDVKLIKTSLSATGTGKKV